MHTPMIRTTLRATVAAALVTLAACSDNSATGLEEPSLKRGSSTAGTTASGGTVSSGRTLITLSRPAGAPFATAKGKAKYSNRGGERELEIEAENIPVGTAVEFVLGGVVIGSGTASSLREVELNLNSDRGATVPASVAGQNVVVRTAAGAVIVSGSF